MLVVIDNAARIAMVGLLAGLLLAAADAAAQGFPGEGPAASSLPPVALGMSPDAVRALNEELAADATALDMFGGGRKAMDRFAHGGYERVKPWTFYGRLGVFNFQDTVDPSRSEGGRITFSRTGPKLTGRYYIGIHRTF